MERCSDFDDALRQRPNIDRRRFLAYYPLACKERTQGDVGRHVAERSLWRFVKVVKTKQNTRPVTNCLQNIQVNHAGQSHNSM